MNAELYMIYFKTFVDNNLKIQFQQKKSCLVKWNNIFIIKVIIKLGEVVVNTNKF